MNFPKSIFVRAPIITVSALASSSAQTIPQTPSPLSSNPFDTMSATNSWEVTMDERIALAKECQTSDCAETLGKLLMTPTFDAVVQNGEDGDSSDSRIEIRALHQDTVMAGRKAYEAFHETIDELKKDGPKEDAWEEKIGAAALLAKDAMLAALDKFAVEYKAILRLVDGEEDRVENAVYFSYCVNGFVLFTRKVNEALHLVYESRKGGQQRVWTALDTAGRMVHEAEVA